MRRRSLALVSLQRISQLSDNCMTGPSAWCVETEGVGKMTTERLESHNMECGVCPRSKLIRVCNSPSDDRVYCPICYRYNDYARVRRGSALLDGSHVDQNTRGSIDRLYLEPFSIRLSDSLHERDKRCIRAERSA